MLVLTMYYFKHFLELAHEKLMMQIKSKKKKRKKRKEKALLMNK